MTIVASGLHVRIGAREVLVGASLVAHEGRITGLIGPNGAGKSTLLRALAGLQGLAGGRITIAGERLSDIAATERGRRIAYLPQERIVHWPLAVRRIVALGRLPYRHDRAGADPAGEGAIDRAMREMDVAHLAERPALSLSGGELARVLVARSLAQETPAILADEPTAGLDPRHALALFEVFGRLAQDGRTIVIALHDLSLAARFCHDVVMLTDGRIAAAGAAGDVLRPEPLAAVFGARMAVGVVDGVPAVLPKSAIDGGGGA